MTSPRPLQTPHSSRLVTLRLRHLSDFDAAKTRRSIKSPARGKNKLQTRFTFLSSLPHCFAALLFPASRLVVDFRRSGMSERTLNARFDHVMTISA
ncbi:hypothetical protein BaRGS_00027392 [Batillaria attramentaria]|uniref:Uncharacterized protein n=1 Tax=Batillaria attramentaria TaxID=370345 RepID=A0ABD0K1Q8_9CAEN